jgi:monoamine oxidase
VVVIGGGLGGLVAAYELQKSGISATVLEASDVWGGRVATAYYPGGATAESGLQEIWKGNPLNDIAKELGVAFDDESDEAYSSVVIDGKLIEYGHGSADAFFKSFLSPAERKALEGWIKIARRLRDQARQKGVGLPAVRELQDLSFADWIGKQKLPHKVSEWIRLTVECELASEWQGFSALEALLEIDFILEGGLPSRHIKGGNSKLVDAIVRALRGEKMLSATAVRVEWFLRPDRGAALRVSYRKNRHVETLVAERVVVAVPFMQLHQIDFQPPLDQARWDAINTLGRGQYTVVHLMVDKKIDEKPFPILTDGPLGVIYGPVDDGVFSLLIYGNHAQSFHMVPRETKLAEIKTELDRMWPGFATHVLQSFVYTYHPAALPVWPPGRSPLDEKAELLRTAERGIYFAGDFTEGAHSSAAAQSGIRVAKQIAAELTK